jgi:hypothetical protein
VGESVGAAVGAAVGAISSSYKLRKNVVGKFVSSYNFESTLKLI